MTSNRLKNLGRWLGWSSDCRVFEYSLTSLILDLIKTLLVLTFDFIAMLDQNSIDFKNVLLSIFTCKFVERRKIYRAYMSKFVSFDEDLKKVKLCLTHSFFTFSFSLIFLKYWTFYWSFMWIYSRENPACLQLVHLGKLKIILLMSSGI